MLLLHGSDSRTSQHWPSDRLTPASGTMLSANPVSARNPSGATGFRLLDNQINLQAGRLTCTPRNPDQTPRSRPPSGTSSPRGEFAPPTLRQGRSGRSGRSGPSPRGEFAPPTLRHVPWLANVNIPYSSEGRIRPSYIAARSLTGDLAGEWLLRGANSPLLHCGQNL